MKRRRQQEKAATSQVDLCLSLSEKENKTRKTPVPAPLDRAALSPYGAWSSESRVGALAMSCPLLISFFSLEAMGCCGINGDAKVVI